MDPRVRFPLDVHARKRWHDTCKDSGVPCVYVWKKYDFYSVNWDQHTSDEPMEDVYPRMKLVFNKLKKNWRSRMSGSSMSGSAVKMRKHEAFELASSFMDILDPIRG